MTNPDEVKGKIKQAAGDLTGNENLKNEGKVDEIAGKLKETLTDAVDSVKKALHKALAISVSQPAAGSRNRR